MKHILCFCLILSWTGQFANANTLDNRVKIKKKSTLKRNELPSDEFNEEKQTLLSRKRVALINDIKKFIREAKSTDQKAELNLRLGNLYTEEYRYLLTKVQSKGGNNSEAMASLDKAQGIYKDLLSKNPNHPRKDEMLYFLAMLYQDQGKNQEAVSLFQRLTKESPSSKYLPEALIQLGDFYFDNNKFTEAEPYFTKVMAHADAKTRFYATYKKAWCAYNTHRSQVSLNLFKSIIDAESTTESNYLLKLKTEALRDISLPFVELHMAEPAVAFFQSQEEPHNKKGLESLANLFLEKGDYKNAILVNQKLLAMDSSNPKNPDYDLAIVEALRLSNNSQMALERLFAQLPNYMPGSSWHELNAASPSTVKAAETRFEELARKYALELHAEGQKTKNDQLYGLARSLYQKYLEQFALATHAPTIRFYLAEILFKQSQFLAAADQYYAVYKSPSAGNLRMDSIHYALNALDKEMNNQRKKAGLSEISKSNSAKIKDGNADSTPSPLNSVESKFIQVAEDYISHFPKAKDTADILYQVAYLKYSHHDYPESYKTFWALIQSYPGHPTSYFSAYLILDILNKREEYPKLVQACQKFLGNSVLSKAEFKTEIKDILRHSELKRVQQIEEAGNFKEAAQAYLEYTKSYGAQDESLFEKALFNASVTFYKSGDVLRALETQEQFLRRFPNSQLKENMLLQVAKTYESLANFEKAASYFEAFSTQFPLNKQSSQALRLAGLYAWGAKNETKAEQLMKLYISKYPKDSSLVSADLLDLYESQNDLDKQMKFYLENRAKKGISYADYLAYTLKIAELQSGNTGSLPAKMMDEALRVTQKFQKSLMQSKLGIDQMAKTLFWFAGQKEQVYYQIKLTLPQRNLELSLKRKLALLKEMEKEFSNVAKLGGGEWGLGAIFKTANAYQVLAQDIAQAPVPAQLTGEQLDQYRTELKKQLVIPFTEKALSLVGQCLDKSQEFTVYSQWTAKCYSLGSDINPERYPVIKTFYLPAFRVAMPRLSESSPLIAGKLLKQDFPFDSAALFSPNQSERMVASTPTTLPSLFEGMGEGTSLNSRSNPTAFTYRILENQRQGLIEKALESNPSSQHSSYAYLHYLRLHSPKKAQGLIRKALETDPSNASLHNLLGLTYMDLGQLIPAKMTWLSLIARGFDSPEIQNNLGVVSLMMGHENRAFDFFKSAVSKESSIESLINLGFLSLKYRNGVEAKQYFERAIALNPEEKNAKVGLGIALLQNRDFESAKEALSEATSQFGTDPFAKLSHIYFLIDIEKDRVSANQILQGLSEVHTDLDKDAYFRQAIQDIRKSMTSSASTSNEDSESVPSLPN